VDVLKPEAEFLCESFVVVRETFGRSCNYEKLVPGIGLERGREGGGEREVGERETTTLL
jgi:hypothetical protein